MAEDIETEDMARAALAARLLVVIPVLNEEAHIETCLASLFGDDEALHQVECIVADGGSTDKTRAIVERLQGTYENLRLIDNLGRLQSAGVNAGARAGAEARDILIRCDAHSLYPKDFLLRVAGALVERDCDSLVVPMDAVGKGCFQKANAWVVDTPLGSGGSPHRGGHRSGYVDHGHHAAFKRERFLALGGYDESFSHNEDAEYDARLRADGGRIYLDASIRIRYYPRANSAGLWQQYYSYGQGRARNLMKNGEKPKLRQLVPVLNVLALGGTLVLALLVPAFLLWPILYLGLLLAMSAGLVVMKRSFCGLLGGVALGIMHVSWGTGFLRGLFASFRRRQA